MGKMFRQIAIIGVGLIGGSLGMAVKKHKLVDKVIGIDVTEDHLALAKDFGAIDQGSTSYDAVAEAELVILAAPITVNLDILQQIKSFLKPQAIITDVSSTKGNFVRNCERALTGSNYFVGGHPMAGSETAGIKGADPYLFENAIYLVTPTEQTNENALAKVKKLVEQVGAHCILVAPAEHDTMVAAVSHLPHLVASTLVKTAAKIDAEYPLTLMLAAGGFKDTTRIASGNADLWTDICFSNKTELLKMVTIFKQQLTSFGDKLTAGLNEEFAADLQSAKNVRDEIPAKLKGYWPFLEEIIVTIPDKPGMIGQVAAILGSQSINIDDIEILHVREGEGGTLRLGFAQNGLAPAAVNILKEHGFLARMKVVD